MAWRRIDVHRAAERGDMAVLTRYLDAGGDAEKKDTEYAATPVHWASLRGRLDALSLLLNHGADLEARTGTEGTPLVWGCMGGNAGVVQHLLGRGANISAMTKGKGTALHHATHSGHPEVVAMLLEKGADPKAQDNRGERPGDKFDPEVSDSIRRAITKALAKAKGESSSSLRRSRSRRSDRPRGSSLGHKPRGTHGDEGGGSSKHHRSGNGDSRSSRDHRNDHAGRDAPDDDQPDQQPDQRERTPRSTEPSLAAAVTAAALVHGSVPPDRRSGSFDIEGGEEEDSLAAAAAAAAAAAWTPKPTKVNRSGASDNGSLGAFAERDERADSARSNGDGNAAAAAGGPIDRPRSAYVTRPRADHGGSGRKLLDSSPSSRRMAEARSSSPPLQRELFSSAEAAAAAAALVPASRLPTTKDVPDLDELRRQEKFAALAAGAAGARDSEGRAALRRALEEVDKRAEETARAERARSHRLAALVQALEQRLLERDNQVRGLRAELEDRDARLRRADEKVASLRTRSDTQPTETLPTERPTTPEPSVAYPARPRTRSSPTLSPTSRDKPSAAGYDQGGGLGSGVGYDNGASPGRERRSTVGPGTGVVDDVSAYAALGWWRRGDWLEGAPAVATKQQTPAPVVVQNQESLGSLYSMIARR